MEISSFELGLGGCDGAEEQKKTDLKGNGDESLARFGLKWVCFDAARRAIFAQLDKSMDRNWVRERAGKNRVLRQS